MDIRQLRYFSMVAKHLNFTAAAKEAHLDQSAISKQIADLETRIGLKLFVRNTRSVQLTAAGRELLKYATEIVAKSEEAISRAHLAASGGIGILRIGFTGSMEQEKDKLPSFIKQFHSKHSGIKLSLLRYNMTPLSQALERGDVDIAFTFSYGLHETSGINWRICPFYPQSRPMCFVLPVEHPLAVKDKISLQEVAHEPFVIISRDEAPNFDHMERLCTAHGFSPNIVCETPVLETLLLLVETGIGITILAQHTEAFAGPNVRFVEIANYDYRVERVIAWKEANPNPLVAIFLDAIKAH
ncbi:DNA-binding transcriptional LysR family regulator [Anaerospora hongkongensis]|uniref:DNA-binding transcriptional LysR family regulator n=1 Tax=Anaerospora hongkongensis TaxID=244830 RepID=A0A4R1PWU1_9FIRM|nr:LysR family transcriptional regulator [Anaerospora hongkongensis]TCL36937.1 DNA-binding transcriptional LysR family regulator [Anaerospora hongkongensis]